MLFLRWRDQIDEENREQTYGNDGKGLRGGPTLLDHSVLLCRNQKVSSLGMRGCYNRFARTANFITKQVTNYLRAGMGDGERWQEGLDCVARISCTLPLASPASGRAHSAAIVGKLGYLPEIGNDRQVCVV